MSEFLDIFIFVFIGPYLIIYIIMWGKYKNPAIVEYTKRYVFTWAVMFFWSWLFFSITKLISDNLGLLPSDIPKFMVFIWGAIMLVSGFVIATGLYKSFFDERASLVKQSQAIKNHSLNPEQNKFQNPEPKNTGFEKKEVFRPELKKTRVEAKEIHVSEPRKTRIETNDIHSSRVIFKAFYDAYKNSSEEISDAANLPYTKYEIDKAILFLIENSEKEYFSETFSRNLHQSFLMLCSWQDVYSGESIYAENGNVSPRLLKLKDDEYRYRVERLRELGVNSSDLTRGSDVNESEYVSSEDMSIEMARRVIREYGVVLEKSTGVVMNENALPYTKRQIQEAILMSLKIERDKETKKMLFTGYILLAEWQDSSHFSNSQEDKEAGLLLESKKEMNRRLKELESLGYARIDDDSIKFIL